ncbi:MAG TPA: enoyl-CoA hydratase/isomerase family protein [Gammaproteobacteria bacterium]|nr:enoyl-CoA hydratase/isomerase family protein [Gammaproteobacteria bacterium]
MNDNVFFTQDERGVATITLNRPELHNAFDDALIKNLITILQQLQNNAEVKVVVLAAAGKSFSAGADLNWMKRMSGYSYAENLKDAQALSELLQTLKLLKQPTIARVQGATFGGGVGLVACCDMAVASNKASFCLSEVKFGLIPAVISPYVLATIGERAMRRYALTAEIISAEEAQRLGLVSVVTTPEQLDTALQELLHYLLQNSPQAVSAAKALINRVSSNPYDERHLQLNTEAIATIRVSPEGQEGLNAFLTKRKPAWCPKEF